MSEAGEIKIIERDGKPFVWDIVRQKYVALTPEEEVRQQVVHHLLGQLGYPRSLTRVEMGLELNGLQKRCDIAVFDKEGKAKLIVECKRPAVKLKQDSFDQIARYNMTLQVPYLLVTNGEQTYSIRIDLENKSFEFLGYIPSYEQIIS